MYEEQFEVAIEGYVYKFSNLKDAFEEYEKLLNLGYHETVLRKRVKGCKTVYIWDKRAGIFFAWI